MRFLTTSFVKSVKDVRALAACLHSTRQQCFSIIKRLAPDNCATLTVSSRCSASRSVIEDRSSSRVQRPQRQVGVPSAFVIRIKADRRQSSASVIGIVHGRQLPRDHQAASIGPRESRVQPSNSAPSAASDRRPRATRRAGRSPPGLRSIANRRWRGPSSTACELEATASKRFATPTLTSARGSSSGNSATISTMAMCRRATRGAIGRRWGIDPASNAWRQRMSAAGTRGRASQP